MAVHVVFVIRATGAAVSCGACEGDWLAGCGAAAVRRRAGTVADQALWLKARPPPLWALTTQRSWLPTSALVTT